MTRPEQIRLIATQILGFTESANADGVYVRDDKSLVLNFDPFKNPEDTCSVLEKCAAKSDGAIEIDNFVSNSFSVKDCNVSIIEGDLKSAICEFAIKLFGKGGR